MTLAPAPGSIDGLSNEWQNAESFLPLCPQSPDCEQESHLMAEPYLLSGHWRLVPRKKCPSSLANCFSEGPVLSLNRHLLEATPSHSNHTLCPFSQYKNKEPHVLMSDTVLTPNTVGFLRLETGLSECEASQRSHQNTPRF